MIARIKSIRLSFVVTYTESISNECRHVHTYLIYCNALASIPRTPFVSLTQIGIGSDATEYIERSYCKSIYKPASQAERLPFLLFNNWTTAPPSVLTYRVTYRDTNYPILSLNKQYTFVKFH